MKNADYPIKQGLFSKILFFKVFLMCFMAMGSQLLAAEVRKSVWDGAFYPAEKKELIRSIKQYTRQAEKTPLTMSPGKSLRALILPHAGYIYSGYTAAHASRVIPQGKFTKIILAGPDHRVGFPFVSVSKASAYLTPLGTIPIHSDTKQLLKHPDFRVVPSSDKVEHSLEVILPFLQQYNGEFQLVPIVMGKSNPQRIATYIDPLMTPDTLLVASSDLSHYLPYADAVVRDRETIDAILHLKDDLLERNDNRACGSRPILLVMQLARRYGWEPVLLHYTNSGDTAGDKAKVVGYTAIAFYGDSKMQKEQSTQEQFNKTHGQTLVRLARQSISEKLGQAIDSNAVDKLRNDLADECFAAKRGTFVTLHIKGQLRGCIGNLSATDSVVQGVKRNAVNAAFNDHRFKPLSPDEFDKIDIEISILSEPAPLAYNGPDDLIAKLRPGIDGVIIKKGFHNATFLPQVWEQLPRTEEFLAHLCRKAGLPTDAWRTAGLEIMTYQVQYFAEED
ncbi:AmmeMemoRadiSam system protein B [Thermodesulfobacteriota bacterium]